MKTFIFGLAAVLATGVAAQGGQSSLCPLRSEAASEYTGCLSASEDFRMFKVDLRGTKWNGDMVTLTTLPTSHHYFGLGIVDGRDVMIFGTLESGPIEAVVVEHTGM